MNRYAKLFEKVRLGKLTVKNRIVMSPMQTRFLEGIARDATFTHWYAEYFRERARGGVGLIITGHIKAEKEIDPYPLRSVFPVIDRDERIKEFALLTETVHRYGAKIAAQLSAGTGRLADAFLEDRWPAAPSVQPNIYFPNLMLRELTRGEIARLIEAYGRAADRIKKAGFDALYVHAMAFLLDQFISSCWNRRKDEYGGNLQNRLRFLKECMESARSHVGGDFPTIVGLALEHKFEGGRKLDETIALAKEIETWGIDAFHVRDGSYDGMEALIPNAHYPDGRVLENAEKFKKEIKTPIITDGKFADPEACLEALQQQKTDLIGMARQLLADPEWPKKVKRGAVEEIRPCIRCMECFDRIRMGKYMGCSVNPRVGHERELPVLPASKPRSVLVIGGGPAGMEAARIAALRGHRVTLVERRETLGGRLAEASVPDYKHLIGKFNNWLERQIRALPVDVRTGLEADEALVKEINPEVIVIAAGAKESCPDVPGRNMGHVVTASDVLRDKASAGGRVVVIGGGPVGCDTAHKLASDGKAVVLIEMLPEILREASVFNKFSLMRELSSLGVEIHTNSRLVEIKENGVVVLKEGEEQFIEADAVILATGFKGDETLFMKLEDLAEEVYQIGDVASPRKIYDAIQEGHLIGKEI